MGGIVDGYKQGYESMNLVLIDRFGIIYKYLKKILVLVIGKYYKNIFKYIVYCEFDIYLDQYIWIDYDYLILYGKSMG